MTPQFIHGTEVAYWENAAEVMVALLNAIPDSGFNCVFLESTPNGANGTFFDTWQKARWPTDEECPRGQEGYWKQWASLSPDQEAEAGGLEQFAYVRGFAAGDEFDDARVLLNESEKRGIESRLDPASWDQGEPQMIELYGIHVPKGHR